MKISVHFDRNSHENVLKLKHNEYLLQLKQMRDSDDQNLLRSHRIFCAVQRETHNQWLPIGKGS